MAAGSDKTGSHRFGATFHANSDRTTVFSAVFRSKPAAGNAAFPGRCPTVRERPATPNAAPDPAPRLPPRRSGHRLARRAAEGSRQVRALEAGLDALKFSFNPEDLGPNKGQITSHFGSGILTFSLPYLFRTSPGYGMLVRGPTNCAKDGAAPLDGIVETDWAPYSFTMNW
ncbi:MAG TPA: DUF6065 family protein, partial [Burkholderiaceae bacterium]|nr:DUF6065 family protein [Burkholderiaceae bacterium]